MTEPRWIAYELHDGLLQWVVGARMHIAGLVAAMNEHRTVDDLEKNLSQVLSYLNQATEEGRHLIRFIEGLEEGQQADVVSSLAATCQILSRKVREGQPPIEFYPPEQAWPELPPAQAWSIVRIAQQAAVNAIRHSQGSLVKVSMNRTDSQLGIIISDDGRGFDPEAEYPGHFGLKSMRQRARDCGLTLRFESSQQGTTVTLLVGIPDREIAT